MPPYVNTKSTIHFPGFNNLRFLAALVILVYHQEYKKKLLGFEYHWVDQLFTIGDLAVTLFFVLSGFLITYLLIAEKNATNTIAIKKYYMRRILRIWPLYYLILILGFFILPHIGLFQLPTTGLIDTGNFLQLFLFFLFFANIGFLKYGNLSFMDQTWSVAVEEQFYLIWPFIIKYVKNIVPVLWVIIIIFAGARGCVGAMYQHGETYRKAYSLLYYLRLDNMAIGGVFAYILFYQKTDVLNLIYNKYVQWVNMLLLAFLWANSYVIPYIHHLAYAVMFGIVILNAAANAKVVFKVKNRLVDYFGKISYGIYMYHNIMIVASLKLCAFFLGGTSTAFFIVSYLVSILLTLWVAHLSYQYVEKYFLSFKNRFAVIKSSD